MLRLLTLAAAAALALPATAMARDTTVTSYDGTAITTHFFPAADLPAGAQAPTVLVGPGWSSPGATDPEGASDPGTGSVGVGPLRHAGFNVVTWDPRGFGSSGGTVTVDGPENEGRDVQALIDFVAGQPEAALDKPGDPRVGMSGGSYGGGIQLVAAGLDRRIDALVPDIAWHSLTTSLYKDATFKTGWGGLLYGLGSPRGRLDPHIDSAAVSGFATGRISSEDERWFASRGPGDALVSRIRVPTLLMQGTVDTLFTLQEAITNYRRLQADDPARVSMLWFCGGHGACLTDAGDATLTERRAIAWLRRHLAGDRTAAAGPGFEWIDQRGRTWDATAYPPARGAPVTAAGAGTLPLQLAGGSGPTTGGPGATAAVSGIANGTRAANAVDVPIAAAPARRLLVGAPKVTLTYSGSAAQADGRVYGQIVDDVSGTVLGNLVTPIPVTLDGKQHTVTRRLEAVAATLDPGQTATLQIVARTTAYDTVQPPAGAVTFKRIALAVPTADAARLTAKRLAVVAVRRAGTHRMRVTVRALGGTARRVRIVVRSAQGHRIGARRLRTVSGRRVVTVRIRSAVRGRPRVSAASR